MSLNLKNTVCNPDDALTKLKKEILELIQLKKITCNNLPNVDFSLPSIPSINPSQAVIELLMDIISLLNGINFDQMRMQLIDWLIEQTRPLEKNLSLNLKLGLKECYACKISPLMPDWLLYSSGPGINIEISKIDLECLFGVNPSSEVGKLRYDGNSTNDLNVFLWDVIQANGTPLLWKDPVTSQEIAWFTYLENNNTAFTEGGVPQTTNAVPEVIKMQIADSFQSKSVITFINDYINSLNPLFDADKVIPNVINLIFGTLTKEIDLSDQCLIQQVELEQAISDYVTVGLNDPEVVIDDSFYSFNPEQVRDIKSKVREINNGGIEFKTCCKKQTSNISFNTLKTLNDDLKNATNKSEKIQLLTKGMEDLQKESSDSISEVERSSADGEFWYNFIKSLQISLTKLVLSPKNLILINTMYYLVNKESLPSEQGIKGFLKNIECILREMLKEIIRKIIYDYLLPMVIKALKNIILCVIAKKLKEKGINYRLSLESLLPAGLVDALDEVNQILGKAGDIVGDAQGFTDRLNLNSLNNINLQRGTRGRFCD